MSNVPKLRFKEFSEEWESKKLGDICEIIMGQSPSSSCYNENNIGLPLIQGKADIKDRKTLPRIYTSDITKICDVGDIIMSVRAPVGYISKSSQKSCIGRGVCGIKAKQNREFIYQFLIGYEDKWDKISQGSTFESINRNDIDNTKISIPSLQEQEKIAFFLSLIDDKINLQSEKVKYLKDYKKGLMQKIFSGELRFKDENGNDYPEWEEKKLGEILSIPDKIKENYICKDRLLTVKLHRKGIQVNENTETLNIGSTVYYKRKAGQLIYGKQNFFNGAIDIIPDKLDGFISSGDVPSLDINENIANGKFILGYIGRESFYKKTEALATGTGSKRLHENILFEININLPCLDEQNKISNLLSSVDKKIEKEQEKLDSLNEYKKGLLQQMFV